MARLAGKLNREVVWDPFCGSGLELIETALRGGVQSTYGTDISANAIAISVRERRTEMAVLKVLGFQPWQILLLVLGEAVLLTAAGVLVGVPVALVGARVLRGQLFGIGIFDPPSVAGAVLVLVVSAALAAYIPALRASRVAPLEALRAE